MYESGALCALAEALPGVDFTALDGYVGVSAGSFIAAGLANGTSPRQLCTSFVENDGPRSDRIHPGLFFRPAFGGCAQRLATVPRLLPQAGYSLAVQRGSRLAARFWLLAAAKGLGRALSTGLFSSAAVQRQLAQVFSSPGRTDDSRQLKRRLVLVATELDSGEAAPLACPAGTTCPSRKPWRPARRCPAFSRPSRSTAAGMGTVL